MTDAEIDAAVERIGRYDSGLGVVGIALALAEECKRLRGENVELRHSSDEHSNDACDARAERDAALETVREVCANAEPGSFRRMLAGMEKDQKIKQLTAQVEALQADNERLRDALQDVAKRVLCFTCDGLSEHSQIARAALSTGDKR